MWGIGIDMTKIVELILTTETRGKGTKDDVVRIVYQLFNKNGDIIAECDGWADKTFVDRKNIAKLNEH